MHLGMSYSTCIGLRDFVCTLRTVYTNLRYVPYIGVTLVPYTVDQFRMMEFFDVFGMLLKAIIVSV